MDQHEKSELLATLMGIQAELRASREAREKAQTVHVHVQPRVSFDTVLLAIIGAAITAGMFIACGGAQ